MIAQRQTRATSTLPRAGARSRIQENNSAQTLVALFVLALLLPSYFFLGDLRLSPVRLLLLATFIPLLARLVSGAAGQLRGIDIFMMLFMVWIVVTLLFHHGIARFNYAIISVVELFGGYLIGRVMIRSDGDFRKLFIYMLLAMIFLFPFVVVELLTDRNILQDIFRKFLPTYSKGGSSYGRLGLNRVMAGFEHPILYGLFCALAFAPLLFIFRATRMRSAGVLIFVAFMTFASLSSAPLLAVAIQIGLLIWWRVTGGQWKLLAGLVVTAYVTVDLLSNRTPITILINYISFDPNTAWTRVMTWRFGSLEMWKNPIFGIGLNDWERPYWLTGSVDNFWLLTGMRYGVLGVGLLIAGLISGSIAILRSQTLSEQARGYRVVYLVMLVSLYFTLTTVHVWAGMSSFVMLVIGAGMWLADPQAQRPSPDEDVRQPPSPGSDAQIKASRYSRFPPRAGHS